MELNKWLLSEGSVQAGEIIPDLKQSHLGAGVGLGFG